MLRWETDRKKLGRDQMLLNEKEMAATVQQIEQFPAMGGKKGRANLIHNQKALIGAETYKSVQREMMSLCGRELASRRLPRKTPPPFQAPTPNALNEVWSADLFSIQAWGHKWEVSVVQDLYNQERLAFEPYKDAADAEQVRSSLETARLQRGGQAPTICTKTDRDARYTKVFKDAFAEVGTHLRIPPGCPWYNGEIERGQRDNKDVLAGVLAKMERPKPGQEILAMQIACNKTAQLLNTVISRPSLGNVTPAEIAKGIADEVRQRNHEFIEKGREERRQRAPQTKRWRQRLADTLDLSKWDSGRLLRFLRLSKRDYGFLAN